jgi:hypothetical protein
MRSDKPPDLRSKAIRELLVKLQEVMRDHKHNPLGRIPVLAFAWARTRDPRVAWEAYRICAANKVEIPEWVANYLADCATRMSSLGDAGLDTRKALPAALGFPAKRGPKPGPKPVPLHDGDDDIIAAEHFFFAHIFSYVIGCGHSPSRAVREASNLLGPGYADLDERTLVMLVVNHFGWAEMPQSKAAWRQALVAMFK